MAHLTPLIYGFKLTPLKRFKIIKYYRANQQELLQTATSGRGTAPAGPAEAMAQMAAVAAHAGADADTAAILQEIRGKFRK
jgi:hypothetical protein